MSDFGAKHLILAAIALVIGLALGGLGPRSQVRALTSQLAELQDRECEAGPSRVGRDIANVFQGRPWEDQLDEADAPDEPATAPGDDDGEGSGFRIQVGDDDQDPEVPEDLEESLDMMRDAMELRRAQARAALEEQADASDQQLDDIDAAIEDMNADLAALAEDFVANLKEFDGEPDRRETMLFARDTLDVLLEAEDALYNALGPDQRDGLDEAALDPFSYVDGQIIETFMELDQP